MKKVAILTPCYVPGYKAGGPIQTVKNLCDYYKNKADIYVVTLNHDEDPADIYEGVSTNLWVENQGVHVWYADDENFGLRLFEKIYNEFDTIYSCSLFAKNTYLLLLIHWMRKNENKSVFVAPMGVLKERAFMNKGFKKRIFMLVSNKMKMYKSIVWSFTSPDEYASAKLRVKEIDLQNYIVAEDLPAAPIYSQNDVDKKRIEGTKTFKIIFLSRIVPHKNLIECFEIMSRCFDEDIQFDVYGIIEDEKYWNACLSAAQLLPENISFSYKGEIKPAEVMKTFHEYDMFLFPTKGENFGHVIYEALASGCVPVISDTTPWEDLNIKRAGYVIKYGDVNGYLEVIRDLVKMKRTKVDDYFEIKRNAIKYALEKYHASVENSGYDEVFLE